MGIEKASAGNVVIEVFKWLGNISFVFVAMALLSILLSRSEVKFYSRPKQRHWDMELTCIVP